ncbi:MAG: hypothetical protein ACYTHM_11565 [Planctomycetota bacterium]
MKFPLLGILILLVCSGKAWTAEKKGGWWWTEKEQEAIREKMSEVVEKEGVFSVESKHWIVETKVPGTFCVETLLFMDLVTRFYETFVRLDCPVRIQKKPKVVVFPNGEEYKKRFKDGSRGQFDFRYDYFRNVTSFCLYTYLENDREKDFIHFYKPILLHEGTHLLTQKLFGCRTVPLWLDEGLATFIQFWDLRKDGKENRKNRYKRSPYLQQLKGLLHAFKGEGHPLDYLFGVDLKRWNPDGMGRKAHYHYGLAESLIDMFLSTEEGKKSLNQILKKAIASPKVFPMDEAMRGQVKQDWDKHVAGLFKVR